MDDVGQLRDRSRAPARSLPEGASAFRHAGEPSRGPASAQGIGRRGLSELAVVLDEQDPQRPGRGRRSRRASARRLRAAARLPSAGRRTVDRFVPCPGASRSAASPPDCSGEAVDLAAAPRPPSRGPMSSVVARRARERARANATRFMPQPCRRPRSATPVGRGVRDSRAGAVETGETPPSGNPSRRWPRCLNERDLELAFASAADEAEGSSAENRARARCPPRSDCRQQVLHAGEFPARLTSIGSERRGLATPEKRGSCAG